MNSNNLLEVLIAGVKLTPRVKDVSTFEGNRRVKPCINHRSCGDPQEDGLLSSYVSHCLSSMVLHTYVFPHLTALNVQSQTLLISNVTFFLTAGNQASAGIFVVKGRL